MNFLTKLISRIFAPEPEPMGRNGAMRLMLIKADAQNTSQSRTIASGAIKTSGEVPNHG